MWLGVAPPDTPSVCFSLPPADVIRKLEEKPDQRGQLRDGRTGPFFSLWILGSVDTEEEV